MPDPWKCQISPLRGKPARTALHDLVGALVLLVVADDFETAPFDSAQDTFLLVGGEEGEVGQDVEHHAGTQQGLGDLLDVDQPPGSECLGRPPGSPFIDRGVDGPIAQVFALGGYVEDVGREEFGDETLVIVVDLFGAIEPTDGLAHGGFGLHQHQGEAVNEEHQVGATFDAPGSKRILGGHDVLVLVEIIVVDQADGDVFVARPEGHGAFVAQPGGEFFVGADQAVGAHRQHNGAQLVEHFIGASRDFGNAGIEADESLANVFFDEDVVDAAGQIDGGDIMPADTFGVAPDGEIRRGFFADPSFLGRLRPAEGIPEKVFDGADFVKHFSLPQVMNSIGLSSLLFVFYNGAKMIVPLQNSF